MRNQKPLSARILSLVLTTAMVFTMMPTTVFATEGDVALGASSLECHVTHDADCSHKNEAGGYSCSTSVSDNETATPSEATAVCDHTDGCGYNEAVEGVDCIHSCEICKPLDSGNIDKQPELENCSCDILCIEGKINADCKLCSVEGTDLTVCKGKENIAPAEKSAYDKVVDLFTALPAASELTEENRDTFIAQLDEAMNAFDALTPDEQDLFLAENLELFKAAMALNDAITGVVPAPLASLPTITKTIKSGESVNYSDLKVGCALEPGAKIINKTSTLYVYRYEALAVNFSGAAMGGVMGTADHVVTATYEVQVADDSKGSITTRSVWVVAEVSGSMPRLVCPDPTPTATYTATVVKNNLKGATAAFEILLTGNNSPCTGDSFAIGSSDKLKVTITPNSGNSFQTAPTVSSTATSSAGTPTRQSDGSYTCQLSGFTANPTITVAGEAKVPKTIVNISGLSPANGTYNGVSQVGYTGTASTGAYTGSREYTYYSGSTATGSPLSGAPTKQELTP